MMKKADKSTDGNTPSPKTIERIWTVLYRFCCVCILICLYLYLIAPLLSTFVIPPLSVHDELDDYTQGAYLRFEDSALFEDFLDSLEFVDKGEAVAFYHVNHFLRDNPFWGGKCPDFFSLDIKLSPQDYQMYKDSTINGEVFFHDGNMDDYMLFGAHHEQETYILAFCDADHIVRCALITKTENYPASIFAAFTMNTALVWESSTNNDTLPAT